jgi:hypothetical protein
MQGDRFFTSRRDLRGAILRGEVPPSEIVPLETIHYERDELNLIDLPKAFARKNGTQLSYLGPIVSSLETTIARAATAGVVAGADGSRVLVKNAGVSFWIRVNDRRIATQLRQKMGQKLYVGLHVAPAAGAGEKLVNLPDPVYIRSQGEVPELFISTWAELSARSERDLSRDNVYFLLLEILEVDDGRGSQDIRH